MNHKISIAAYCTSFTVKALLRMGVNSARAVEDNILFLSDSAFLCMYMLLQPANQAFLIALLCMLMLLKTLFAVDVLRCLQITAGQLPEQLAVLILCLLSVSIQNRLVAAILHCMLMQNDFFLSAD